MTKTKKTITKSTHWCSKMNNVWILHGSLVLRFAVCAVCLSIRALIRSGALSILGIRSPLSWNVSLLPSFFVSLLLLRARLSTVYVYVYSIRINYITVQVVRHLSIRTCLMLACTIVLYNLYAHLLLFFSFNGIFNLTLIMIWF